MGPPTRGGYGMTAPRFHLVKAASPWFPQHLLWKEVPAVIRFAPELRLHPDDKYLPTSVPWFLDRVRMRRHRKYFPDENWLDVGEVNVQSLVAQVAKSWIPGGDTEYSGEGSKRTHFFVEIGTHEKETRR